MIQILNFITTNNMDWRIVMLKKYLKKLIIVLFLIVISNNAYALFRDRVPYYKMINYSGKNQFWVIADRYSDLIGVKQHRELAYEAISIFDECRKSAI